MLHLSSPPLPGPIGKDLGYSLVDGDLSDSIPLDPTLGGSDPGPGPFALTLNTNTLGVYPDVGFTLATASQGVPLTLQAQLTWDNGTPGGWVSFSLPGGLTAGQTVSADLQASTQVTQTGVYPYSIEVKATFSGGSPVDVTFTGVEPVVARDATGSGADPYGPGWSITGVDSLLPVAPSTGVPAGVLYLYGSGGSRFFTGTGGTYTGPPDDFGTMASTTAGGVTTYTYTTTHLTTYTFNGTGQLLTVTTPQQLTTTYSYSSGLLSSIQVPDGGTATFVYTSGYLTSV